jgi:hypothetical protein
MDRANKKQQRLISSFKKCNMLENCVGYSLEKQRRENNERKGIQ